MSKSFFESSKKIANEFLQSVVFIDDRAFITEKANHHEFDAKRITQVFGNSKKVCAVYSPETLTDIENLAELAKKSDVTVLDWQINITEVEDEDSEEDVEEDDPRGPHTRKIIREILSDPLTGKGSLKLIVVYTGELDLPGITDEIFKDLQDINIEGLEKGNCCLFTENIRILVAAKPASDDGSGQPKFKHNPELNDKVVNYEELPHFILSQFTEMTSGLLTNFVLQSLTAIRVNTFRLIKLYKKELDPSFLTHRLLLTNPEDSKVQLIETLAHSIQALLNYNETGEAVSLRSVIRWIESQEFNQTIEIEQDKIIYINKSFIKTWIKKSFLEACREQWVKNGFGDYPNTPDKKFKSHERNLFKKASKIFTGKDEAEIDSEFSILTHHKSNLKQPSIVPHLTLGTLLKQLPKKSISSSGNENYFLCIQARCDSVRISDLRKFLFIPLKKAEEGSRFHFVVEEDLEFIKLRIAKEAYAIKTIKFYPNKNKHTVLASKYRTNYYFKSNHGERFKWLADLKDSHAQREANSFAAKVSRVGLDESKWLTSWSR